MWFYGSKDELDGAASGFVFVGFPFSVIVAGDVVGLKVSAQWPSMSTALLQVGNGSKAWSNMREDPLWSHCPLLHLDLTGKKHGLLCGDLGEGRVRSGVP